MIKEVKKFAEDHKKELIIGGCIVVGTVAIGILGRGLIRDVKGYKESIQRLRNSGVSNILNGVSKTTEKAVKPKWDPGRDCVMRFFVEGTEEFLGEAQCAEAFVKDMLDIASEEAF